MTALACIHNPSKMKRANETIPFAHHLALVAIRFLP
jgi:hypothetical protein